MNSSESLKELATALAKAQGDRFQEETLLPLIAKRLRPDRRPTLVERFFEKVVFGMSDCWFWRGSINRLGYGCIHALGESKAHRVSWRLFKGDIPPGVGVLHRCDVRNCVNHEHLFLGDQADNVSDMIDKGRARFFPPQPGEQNGMAKLTIDIVRQMRARREAGVSYRSIAEEFQVTSMTAYRAITGQSWSAA